MLTPHHVGGRTNHVTAIAAVTPAKLVRPGKTFEYQCNRQVDVKFGRVSRSDRGQCLFQPLAAPVGAEHLLLPPKTTASDDPVCSVCAVLRRWLIWA